MVQTVCVRGPEREKKRQPPNCLQLAVGIWKAPQILTLSEVHPAAPHSLPYPSNLRSGKQDRSHHRDAAGTLFPSLWAHLALPLFLDHLDPLCGINYSLHTGHTQALFPAWIHLSCSRTTSATVEQNSSYFYFFLGEKKIKGQTLDISF